MRTLSRAPVRWLGHKDGGALAMRVYGLRDQHSQAMAQKVTSGHAPTEMTNQES